MKIATWNVERLRHKKNLAEMKRQIEEIDADLLVLTETDRRLRPDYEFCLETPAVSALCPALYAPTENRVTVYSRYPLRRREQPRDEFTSLCVEAETERGPLWVYGTIIGVYGNRHPSYLSDLEGQMEDLRRLSQAGRAVCFCGDFNCSFSDAYYFTSAARASLLKTFDACSLSLLTGNLPECIDHIAVTEGFVGKAEMEITQWNAGKTLSDHRGIAVSF